MAKGVRFDLVDVRLFVEVAEMGSLSAAAAAFPLALSAASARIRQLEDRMGVQLFERTHSGVHLTSAGTLFLEHARGILRAARDAQHAMESLSSEQPRVLTIYSNTTGSSGLLPNLVGRYVRENPDIRVHMRESISRKIIEGVRDGSIDVGLIDGDYAAPDLFLMPCYRDHLVLLLPPDHPLLNDERVCLKRICEHAFVTLESGMGFRRYLDRVTQLAGVKLDVRADASSFNAMVQLVAGGVGVAVVPRTVADDYALALGLKTRNIDEPWAVRQLVACVRAGELPVHVRSLMKLIAGLDQATAIRPLR
ncbi:LysR family transcriptional regulator [Burkholderiaceae bacterium DAT-1]|nr:LysR family transcriptional regulator [Burkholderiaceae bacterium DAT-1]